MANNIDAYHDLLQALRHKDKEGYGRIVNEIRQGKYGNEAKDLIFSKEKKEKRK